MTKLSSTSLLQPCSMQPISGEAVSRGAGGPRVPVLVIKKNTLYQQQKQMAHVGPGVKMPICRHKDAFVCTVVLSQRVVAGLPMKAH